VAIITPFFADTSFFNNTEGLIDPYYFNDSLLLHLDGTNGSTTFIDSSPFPKTVTPNGGVQIRTAQSKFGGASAYFDGSGDYLSVPVSSSLDLTSGDFTIECWIYRTVGSVAEQYILSQRASEPTSQGWELRINSANICQFFFTGGSLIASVSTIPVNVWTYIAVTRSSNTTRMFINGALDSSATFSNGTPASSTPTFIGYGTTGGSYFTGYIDELRITKGVARYTTNFIPLSRPFSEITTYPYTIDGVGIASVPFVPRDSSGIIATNTIATIGFSTPDFNAYARTETIYPVPLLIPSFSNIARTETITTIPFAIRNP
jgi:hypothetical protein